MIKMKKFIKQLFYFLSGFFIAIPIIFYLIKLCLSTQDIFIFDSYIVMSSSEIGLSTILPSLLGIGFIFLAIANQLINKDPDVNIIENRN